MGATQKLNSDDGPQQARRGHFWLWVLLVTVLLIVFTGGFCERIIGGLWGFFSQDDSPTVSVASSKTILHNGDVISVRTGEVLKAESNGYFSFHWGVPSGKTQPNQNQYEATFYVDPVGRQTWYLNSQFNYVLLRLYVVAEQPVLVLEGNVKILRRAGK